MFRRYLSLVAALALVAAACSGSGRVAATYEGGQITVAEVNELIPSSADTVDTAQFAATLNRLLIDRIFSVAAEDDYGVMPDESRVAESVSEITDQLTANGQLEIEEALEANSLTRVGLEAIARQQAVFEDILAALADEQAPASESELREVYEAEIGTVAEVCSRHILLESEEEAVAALDRVLAGEEFAALAVELSTGPSGPTGGDLGCGAPAGFVPEFAAATLEAEPGVPFGPVQTEFGWHVILVESRTVPSFDESRQEIEAGLVDVNGLFNDWLIGKLTGANVQVDEQYGTWTLDPAPAVLPPST